MPPIRDGECLSAFSLVFVVLVAMGYWPAMLPV
ncbi:hypothetical protein DFO46_1265 [Rhizobium sp. AG855]|nr:hypothetical protein DFO46_1265 [Rhizobium sp. AG855]